MFPLLVCWSLTEYHRHELIYWQAWFTAGLFCLCLWQLIRNKRRVDVLLIETPEPRTLFAAQNEWSKDKSSNVYNMASDNKSNTGTENTMYTIEASSRYTQFCIFLRLAVKQDKLKKNEQFYSTVLFKWQLSERHFRTLSALINASSD